MAMPGKGLGGSPGEQMHIPGTGLWSITGAAAPALSDSRPDSAAKVTTARGPAPASATNRSPWKFPRCKCACPTSCPCAWCCCPCTCCKVVSWLCAILVLFVVIVGIIVLVCYKVLHPKFPGYDVDDVQFLYNVTGPNAGGAFQLNAETLCTVITSNPNAKIGIFYDSIALGLHMLGIPLGSQVIPAFYNGCGVTKHNAVDMVSGDVLISPATLAAFSAAQSAHAVPLNLKVVIKVRAKIGAMLTPGLKIRVTCLLTLDPSVSSGSQVTNTACSFKIGLSL